MTFAPPENIRIFSSKQPTLNCAAAKREQPASNGKLHMLTQGRNFLEETFQEMYVEQNFKSFICCGQITVVLNINLDLYRSFCIGD